ncbi:hypothetical protein C2845_PM02G27520 [Panicum miliaceum]|uniref:J domain-containing protein n=1 Tax=Panicum miliaceum TaxID=4540 RepID=A0A3L6SI47_PANMI|nr:hypothetical protein C2845_PM02G27520 [Panicum miliaceum]
MYEVLAVEEMAGPEEIKAAYRRAARWWHPDACPGGADRFMAGVRGLRGAVRPEAQARRAGFADWEAQLAGLEWRAAESEMLPGRPVV